VRVNSLENSLEESLFFLLGGSLIVIGTSGLLLTTDLDILLGTSQLLGDDRVSVDGTDHLILDGGGVDNALVRRCVLNWLVSDALLNGLILNGLVNGGGGGSGDDVYLRLGQVLNWLNVLHLLDFLDGLVDDLLLNGLIFNTFLDSLSGHVVNISVLVDLRNVFSLIFDGVVIGDLLFLGNVFSALNCLVFNDGLLVGNVLDSGLSLDDLALSGNGDGRDVHSRLMETTLSSRGDLDGVSNNL
jgi:hypothetical protein